MKSFSDRHGYVHSEKPILFREDAPENIRQGVILIAENMGMTPNQLRSQICGELLVAPDQSNWSPYPNIYGEVMDLIGRCEWFEVYNIAEKFYAYFYGAAHDYVKAEEFESKLNGLFRKEGAGWLMEGGKIIARGAEPFNEVTREAKSLLGQSGNMTASNEIHEAIKDISRRPEPDRTGAVHHAMAAIECMARTLADDGKATLGEILKSKKGKLGIPAPLDEALAKMWGYSSERGRHVREGDEPSFEEAELVVTVASAVCVYLSRKVQ